MGIEELTQLEILQGILGVISLIISVSVGLKIASKYFTLKRTELLSVGIMMAIITSGWWGSALSFLLFVLFNLELPTVTYIFLSYGFHPLTTLLWMYAFSHLIYPHLKRKIIALFVVIGIVYEIFFITFLLTDPSILATRVTRFDSETGVFLSTYILLTLLISFITNYIFMKESLRSDDEKIKWKGQFIFISSVFFIIGAILDSVVPLNTVTLFLTRLLLVISSILGYLGWLLPDHITKWLIK